MLKRTTCNSNHGKTTLISLYCERECEFGLIAAQRASMNAEDTMSNCGRQWNAFWYGEEVQYIYIYNSGSPKPMILLKNCCHVQWEWE